MLLQRIPSSTIETTDSWIPDTVANFELTLAMFHHLNLGLIKVRKGAHYGSIDVAELCCAEHSL
jgi:hypothetical protein